MCDADRILWGCPDCNRIATSGFGQLNSLTYPHIIFSASVMAERGRILHHLWNNIEDSKTVILFVEYDAENWLAHRIMDRNRGITIFREPFRDALLEN